MSYNNALQTDISSYGLVFSADFKVTVTAPVAFPLGITSGDVDLMNPKFGGHGTETKANRVEILVVGNHAGAADLAITGACQGGPEEYICSIAMTFGGTIESGTDVWCEGMTLTSYHLSGMGIAVADDGNNHPTKLGFDAIGYQFLRFYPSGYAGNTTAFKVYLRYF